MGVSMQISRKSILYLVVASVVSLIGWEIFGRIAAPLWIGEVLDPAGLISASFGIEDDFLAHAVHIITGLLIYPLIYFFVVMPVLVRFVPGLQGWVAGLLYGVALWVFALGVVAHFIAGFPAFLGFEPIAWASLVGHLIYGVLLGVFVRPAM